MTIQQILTSLKCREYAHVYFLQGPEVYYIQQITDFFETHVLSKEEQMLNLRLYYGKEHKLEEVLNRTRCQPMLGDKQVIIVKEAQDMVDLHRSDTRAQLEHYLAKPNPQSLLVFAYKYRNINSQSFLRVLKRHKHVLFTTPKVFDRQIPGWINNYVVEKGYTISPEAIWILQGLVGTNLQGLANELQKIMLNLNEGEEISGALVKQHIGMQRALSSFELQRAIAERATDKALQLVHYFVQNEKKHPIIPLVSLLGSFFLKVLQLHALREKKRDQQVKELDIPLFFMKDYQKAAQNHSINDVVCHLHALHRADLQLKGIEGPSVKGGEVLKELVVHLLRPL